MRDRIQHIHALEVLDSRGIPTVRVDAVLEGGATGEATVPGGTSTGRYEATEIRDQDPNRYGGRGVLRSVAEINTSISQELHDMHAADQRAVDSHMIAMDSTANKSNLGANTILGVSIAVARAAAVARGIPLYQHLRDHFGIKERDYYLPTPLMNVINGGTHADSGLDIQEYWIVPIGAERFADRVRIGAEIYQALGTLLREQGMTTGVGLEGGFAPRLPSNAAALDAIVNAIGRTPYQLGRHVVLGMDVAASGLYDTATKQYTLALDRLRMTAEQLNAYYVQLLERYPVALLEDPMAEDDWEGWRIVTKTWDNRIRIIGDDLFVTNPDRFRMGIQQGVANTILIKPNQIGTVTETMDMVMLTRSHKYQVVISHRSGETNDTTIADLAVAVNADFLKAGAPSRGERVAKYNRVMEIEDQLTNA